VDLGVSRNWGTRTVDIGELDAQRDVPADVLVDVAAVDTQFVPGSSGIASRWDGYVAALSRSQVGH
jgi:hypothetical protein